MGWIEDFAKDRNHKSLRALAKAMCASKEWPSTDKRSAETVANKLRDADKGKDVEWWLGTGKLLLPALADALDEDEADLVDRLQQANSSDGDEGVGMWSFKMFPALRPIDFQQEDPFPGVPDEIICRGGPKALRTWWVAPTGAGKTLVGRWLERRFRWTFLQAKRWADVNPLVEGRVFVELSSSDGIFDATIAALPKSVQICIACPDELPKKSESPKEYKSHDGKNHQINREYSEDGVRIVTVKPFRIWVEDFVNWVAARVKPGGGFDAQRVRNLLRDEDIFYMFETPGALLEFLGVIETLGIDKFTDAWSSGKDPRRLVHEWLKAALEKSNRSHSVGTDDILKNNGTDLLVKIETERLRRGLTSRLREDEWRGLVPQDIAPEIQRDTLLAALEKVENDSDVRTTIRTLLRPDSASIITGLKALGALVEVGHGLLQQRPEWVARSISDVAAKKLYNEGPKGIGPLLLFEHSSKAALSRLCSEVVSGNIDHISACVKACTEGSTPLPPEYAVALDGTFRAIGFALARGTKVPTDLINMAWKAQMRHVYQRFLNSPASPILAVAVQDHGRGITSPNAWFAAALAMSRALVDAGEDIAICEMNPWKGLSKDPKEISLFTDFLMRVGELFHTGEDEEENDDQLLQFAFYRLGGDLLDRLGVIRHGTQLLELQAPDFLVKIATGDLASDKNDLYHLLKMPFSLMSLEDACLRRNVDIEVVIAWCWSVSLTENQHEQWPPVRWLHSHACLKMAERVWKSMPADALSDKLCQQLVYLQEYLPVLSWLPNKVWERWLEIWKQLPDKWHSEYANAFKFIPEFLIAEALKNGWINAWCHEIRNILWERMPSVLLNLMDDLAAAPVRYYDELPNCGPLLDLIFVVPDRHGEAFVKHAQAWFADPVGYPGAGTWLCRGFIKLVERRVPGWREIYEIVTKLVVELTT